MNNFGHKQTNATKKRQKLNESFKQFQRLPEWPIQENGEANQRSEQWNETKFALCSRRSADEQARKPCSM
jgi:hypothetical protein